jgi:sugar phosphate isomerase/epimerase
MATSYEGFYGGGDSVFNPSYGNLTGYTLNAANLGFPGSPQSANQVQDTVNAIKHGTKVFEVTMLQPDVGESIPIQHFEEMRALMKLTGVKPSVHAPVIDAVGFGEQGWGKEEGRVDNERRMFAAIEKAQMLDPSGNLPIVFHATNGTPGSVWRPGDKAAGEPDRILESGAAINMETGQTQAVKREWKFRPEMPQFLEKGGTRKMVNGTPTDIYMKGKKGKLFSAEGSIQAMNNGDWSNKLTEVAQMTKHVDEIIGSAPLNLGGYENATISMDGKRIVELDNKGSIAKELDALDVETGQTGAYNQVKKAGLFMENAELSFIGAFGQAYKYGTDDQKKALKSLSEWYSKESEAASEKAVIDGKEMGINIWSPIKRQGVLTRALSELQNITDPELGGKVPELWKLSEDLALDKASDTFGNLASKSYDSFKEEAPVLAIENVYPTQALSSADSLKKLVEESRSKFAKHLVDEKGLSKKKAEKLAEDKIGVTWDIGHLNMVKSKGFTDEEVLRQTKLISEDKSMVKHLHLTDNFGHADTHLVPGMGNVPVKAILEQLEKTGRFDEMRKITEAGGLVQHFKKLPHSMTLAAMGSPIYGMTGSGAWNQAVEMQGAYSGGFGNLNPQTHHSYFGAGFTTMPVELGGAMPGGQSRFGGAPMA